MMIGRLAESAAQLNIALYGVDTQTSKSILEASGNNLRLSLAVLYFCVFL